MPDDSGLAEDVGGARSVRNRNLDPLAHAITFVTAQPYPAFREVKDLNKIITANPVRRGYAGGHLDLEPAIVTAFRGRRFGGRYDSYLGRFSTSEFHIFDSMCAWRWSVNDGLRPPGNGSALLATMLQALVRLKYFQLNQVQFDNFPTAADLALQEHLGYAFRIRSRRETYAPEIRVRVQEADSIKLSRWTDAQLSDHSYFGLQTICTPDDKLLSGGKSSLENDAAAMTIDKMRNSLVTKLLSGRIITHDFDRNANEYSVTAAGL